MEGSAHQARAETRRELAFLSDQKIFIFIFMFHVVALWRKLHQRSEKAESARP